MKWVFILGGSSGFGLASAKKFAEHGYNIFIVHRDRKIAFDKIEKNFKAIREKGVLLESININATTKDGQVQILKKLNETLKESAKIKVFLHCIADGNIKPIISTNEQDPSNTLSEEDFERTIYAMGTSFIIWSKLLFENKLLAEKSRIIGITSEGSQKIMPGYAAVAAAKSVLESGCKYLAAELAQYGITTNLINAGVTLTPALLAIPSFKNIIEHTKQRNPNKRITCPDDVAKVIYLLSTEEADWINGEIIRVDGGEQLML